MNVVVGRQGMRGSRGGVVPVCSGRRAEGCIVRGSLGGEKGRPALVRDGDLEALRDGGDVKYMASPDHEQVATEPHGQVSLVAHRR
eukprot:6087179-Pleurochrysis_carterae.AAC.1